MIELNDGEMICSRCDGSGVHYNRNDKSTFVCSKCNGDGKLDWIENIVGKFRFDDGWRKPSAGYNRGVLKHDRIK